MQNKLSELTVRHLPVKLKIYSETFKKKSNNHLVKRASVWEKRK